MTGAPPLRLSLVTLGVHDLARATKFYEAMGLQRRLRQAEGVVFFDANGVILSLWTRAELAKDANAKDEQAGFSGIALAYNVASEPEVDAVLNAAEQAGGKILKPAQRAFWGGWYGHFADSEGHIWEVAHNPGFAFDVHGHVIVPD